MWNSAAEALLQLHVQIWQTIWFLWPDLVPRAVGQKADSNEDNWLEPDLAQRQDCGFAPTAFQEPDRMRQALFMSIIMLSCLFVVDYLGILLIGVSFGLSNPYLVETEHFA